MGWESEDIEGACDALNEICDETGEDPREMTPRQVEDSIGDELTAEERRSFQLLASVFAADDEDAAELRANLWELG
jgi:hypothetical protein